MFAIRKTHPAGARRLITTDRQMQKVKTFKTRGGAQRWINSWKGQNTIRCGWSLEIVEYVETGSL